jgi:hypothetical protein
MSHDVPRTPKRRVSERNVTMTTLLSRPVLGFLYRRGEWERGTPDAFQQGMMTHAGFTPSVSKDQHGFLMTPQKQLPRTVCSLPHQCRPPTRATMVLTPSSSSSSHFEQMWGLKHGDRRTICNGGGSAATTREGTTSTTITVADRTR